jgi:hypothetical protein
VNPVQKPCFFGDFFQIKKLKTFLGATAQGKKFNRILTKFYTQEKENQLIPIPQT